MQHVASESKKRTWVRPKVTHIKAGSAEHARGARPDGGGGRQGS